MAALSVSSPGCRQEPPPAPPVVRPVKILEIGDRNSRARLEYPGQIRAAQQADMAFEVSGRIIEFLVKEGDVVDEGAVMARLDPRDYQQALEAARAEGVRARAFFERVSNAASSNAVSEQEVTDAHARYDQARARLAIHQKAMDDTELRAPFPGVMARKLVEDFQTVREKEPVLILQDTSTLEIKVAIPERDVAVSSGNQGTRDMTARVQPEVVVSSIPDRIFPARVTEFATTADRETRTFEATLRFDPEDARVFPGMTAKVIATPTRLAGVTWIPANATIADDDGQPFVWLVAPETMTVRRAAVSLGELAGRDVQILSGLANGDQIAISGVHQLREGMEVRRFE